MFADGRTFVRMRRFLALIVPVCLLLLPTAGSLGATTGATGTFCGAAHCVRIPVSLAVPLSQRNESFVSVSAPKPAPFYRITIHATGEGYINRTILWVPSRKLWYLKEYVTPPLSGYWRTENARLDPALVRLAHSVRPFPAPKHWVVPK
jgi:hypothetical protein